MSRHVLVGITGGVAAYKTAQLVSWCVQQGLDVQCVMTPAAEQFIQPTTLAALSGRPVAREMFDPTRFPLGAHIELTRAADLLAVVPASADFLAKAAHGLADDLLSTAYLCFRGPVIMAPAMNGAMWEHPATQRNVAQLQADQVQLVGPDAGWLSCRDRGVGRMAEPEVIGRQILVAAESVDDSHR